MNKVKIVLVGIGGYGKGYLEQLLKNTKYRDDYTLSGVVDPYPKNAPGFSALQELAIPIYESLSEFYRNHHADLVVISSPIHFHCEQTCMALSEGSHVLCEKPIAAVVQDVMQMKAMREKTGKLVGVGYQWSFSKPITALKRDILTGKLGKAKMLKTLVLWPRDRNYYRRNWAARSKDAEGRWILDSVANNATAHYLHNMFYILGKTIDRSAELRQVEAELYRANDIENYDTAVIRTQTTSGTTILFYAGHAVKQSIGPVFEYHFTDAIVYYDESVRDVVVEFSDGRRQSYGDPNVNRYKKLWDMIDTVKTKSAVACGIEAALAQTLCINGASESNEVVSIPREHIGIEASSGLVYVNGLEKLFWELYQQEKMPSEKQVNWANAGAAVNMEGYSYFPTFV